MAEYRVAVIGTGGIARHHAEYYAAHEKTEIVAGADINPERLDDFCEKLGVPARYADYEELLAKEQPDIVSVCTWQDTHPEITIAAAEAGARGIICEKPMGADMAGPRKAVETCERLGVTLVVHHQTRLSPPFAAAKQAIADGMIGEPITAACRCMGGLLNIGSHTIDIALYMLGDPKCLWVVGQAQRRTDRYERGVLCEDLCQAIVALEGGARIALDCDLPDTEIKQDRAVIGTEGMLRTDAESATVLHSGAAGWHTLPTEPQPKFLDLFIDWLEGGPEHRCAARHALAAHEVMMALYESSRTRTLVELPLQNPGSALEQMVADGSMAPEGEPYDIRIEAALKYALSRR